VEVRASREVSVVAELATLNAKSVVKALEDAVESLRKAAAKKFVELTEEGRYALVLVGVSHQVLTDGVRFLKDGAIDGTVPGVIVSTARVETEFA
jgi:citrate lyase beta subunit